MTPKLTRSTAHRLPPDVRTWCLVLAWWRIYRRMAEQRKLWKG